MAAWTWTIALLSARMMDQTAQTPAMPEPAAPALSAPVRSPVHETESASDCPRHDSEAPHLNYWQGYYPPPHPFSYHSVAPYSRHYRFFYGDCCCSAETFGLGAGGGLGTLNFRN